MRKKSNEAVRDNRLTPYHIRIRRIYLIYLSVSKTKQKKSKNRYEFQIGKAWGFRAIFLKPSIHSGYGCQALPHPEKSDKIIFYLNNLSFTHFRHKRKIRKQWWITLDQAYVSVQRCNCLNRPQPKKRWNPFSIYTSVMRRSKIDSQRARSLWVRSTIPGYDRALLSYP